MDKRIENQKKAEIYKNQMVGKRYKHFKGNIYEVLDIGVHSESEECMVIYKSENNPTYIWIRPLDMFLSKVDKEKYPEVIQKYRFELLE